MAEVQKYDSDDCPAPREICGKNIGEVLERRLSRRLFIKLAGAMSSSATLSSVSIASEHNVSFSFKEIPHGLDERLHLASDYSVQEVLKWGDPLFLSAEKFNPLQQSITSQEKQFGFNNDFVAYLPTSSRENSSTHGLLVVNHEYVNSSMMHPGSPHSFSLKRSQIDTEIVAHGLSVVEIKKDAGKWYVQLDSICNRRITPLTAMRFSGPALGHARVRTEFSPRGESCMGTFGNCAGGVTPWGTILTAEENIQAYFLGQASNTKEFESYKRFGLLGDKTAFSAWGKFHSHWDINKHPQAAMHAGWIVEIDPYDSSFTPIKRTALGRCKHEGCDVHVNKDGRVVIYMGDDQVFEYVYRFVSKNKFQAGQSKHNMGLLDEGDLAVAEFTDQGTVIWHSLRWGVVPHTKVNGFNSQADVVLDMRKAADLVGATPMDRPEEIKVNPVTENVFAVFTNNARRTPLNTDAANPRALNRHGHILELIPPEQDHSAHEYTWEVFMLAGDPDSKIDRAHYHTNISTNGWFSSPDNCSFDENGNIWIATDGFNRSGKADGIWVSATSGKEKALSKHFLRAPIGAEICSPCFTPDHKNLFCSVQHPGDGSSFDKPSTRWPDFNENIPPRPSVIAITQDDDGVIGS
ncbi:MAG: PhoX family protein [Gammaproteobacteria bacterium]